MTEVVSGRLVVLDPTVGAESRALERAPRLETLQGKVIGLLDNTKLNSDKFLAYLQEELGRQFGVAGFVLRRKKGASTVAAAELLDELAERCDGVITAVGD